MLRHAALTVLLVASILLSLSPRRAAADERLFTYSYEPDVLLKGKWELEQWATLRTGREEGTFRVLDLRTEIERGFTERLTGALYLNLKAEDIQNEDEDERKVELEGLSTEWKYRMTSPYSSPLGSLLYLELSRGRDETELEEKLVLGRHYDDFVWSANLVLEQEWEEEDGETEKEATLQLVGGASFRLNPHFWLGIEARNHREFPDGLSYKHQEYSAWFLGPNVHYGGGSWWWTLTALPQVYATGEELTGHLQLEDRERLEVRFIAGFLF